MVRMGIAKLNVGTDFFRAYNQAIYDFQKEFGTDAEITDLMRAAREAVEKVALHKLSILSKFRR